AAVRSGAAFASGGAGGHGQNEGSRRCGRVGQEVVEAKGHGTGAYRIYPVADLAAWRYSTRSAAARLQLQAASKDAARGDAFGVTGETARRRAEGSRPVFG